MGERAARWVYWSHGMHRRERTTMDIQAIIDKVVSEAQNAPEIVQELMADPGAAIEKVTGHSLGDTDIAAVAEGVLAQVQEKGGDIVDQLSGLLGNIFGGKE